MPITIVDEAGNEIDIDKADGGTLRKKLEETLQRNKTLEELASTSAAKAAIGEHGYSLVKEEDLKGVSADQVEAKAKELQEQREASRLETVRSVLAERGLDGEDLEAAVEDFLGSKQSSSEGEDFTGIESIGGSRPTRTPTVPKMDDALGNFTSHFEETAKRTRK